NGKVVGALFSASSPQLLPAPAWCAKLLGKEVSDHAWQLLAGREAAGSDKGPLVCACHEVGRNQIVAAIDAGCRDTQSLGQRLRCGTGCGSCLPELVQLLAQSTLPASSTA